MGEPHTGNDDDLMGQHRPPAPKPPLNWHPGKSRGTPVICKPGHHSFQEIKGTFRGEQVAQAIVCQRCRRTWLEVLAQQPETAQAFADYVKSQRGT